MSKNFASKKWVIDIIGKALDAKPYPKVLFGEDKLHWNNTNHLAFFNSTVPADNQWIDRGSYLEDVPPTAAGRSNCIYSNKIDLSDYNTITFVHTLNGMNYTTEIDVSDLTEEAYIVCGSFVNNTETLTSGGFYITKSLDYYAEPVNVLKSEYFNQHINTWLVYDLVLR